MYPPHTYTHTHYECLGPHAQLNQSAPKSKPYSPTEASMDTSCIMHPWMHHASMDASIPLHPKPESPSTQPPTPGRQCDQLTVTWLQ